ncbi:hypothetical protein ABE82_26500 (plasmid) [Paenibacillus peoriae]|nr:hypothetical protein ABE82_26500 [Paenibacillus peoriae]
MIINFKLIVLLVITVYFIGSSYYFVRFKLYKKERSVEGNSILEVNQSTYYDKKYYFMQFVNFFRIFVLFILIYLTLNNYSDNVRLFLNGCLLLYVLWNIWNITKTSRTSRKKNYSAE